MRDTRKSDGSAIDKAFTKVTSSGRIQIGHCDTSAIQHLESNSHSHIFRSLANSGGDNATANSHACKNNKGQEILLANSTGREGVRLKFLRQCEPIVWVERFQQACCAMR